MGQCFPDNAYFYWVCSQKDLESFRWFIFSMKGGKGLRSTVGAAGSILCDDAPVGRMRAECADELRDMRAKRPHDMASKRFELHLFISSVAKGTVPTMLTIPPEDDTHSFWGKEPV